MKDICKIGLNPKSYTLFGFSSLTCSFFINYRCNLSYGKPLLKNGEELKTQKKYLDEAMAVAISNAIWMIAEIIVIVFIWPLTICKT